MLICWFLIKSKQSINDWQHSDIENNIIQLETNEIPFQKNGKTGPRYTTNRSSLSDFYQVKKTGLQISSHFQELEDSSPTFLNHLNSYNS